MGVKKRHIIRRIASELNVSLTEADKIYNVIIDEMLEQLGKRRAVKLSGFGSFQVVNREPKLGRNPRTGERLHIPRHASVKFKMGKHLMNVLNGPAAP